MTRHPRIIATSWQAWPLAVLPLAVLFLPLAGLAQEDGLPAAAHRIEGWLHLAGRGIELVGVAIIILGGVAATIQYLRNLLRGGQSGAVYHAYRASLGRAILLGLEFLVAADIIGTVAVEPTLQNLGVLAGIVLIRTFLSFSLEVEIQGRWPWQQTPAATAEPGLGAAGQVGKA